MLPSLEQIKHLGGYDISHPCYLYPVGTVTSLQKAMLPFHQAKCFRVMGNPGRPLNCMSMRPLQDLISCKMKSFVKSNVVWGSWHSISLQMVVLAEELQEGKSKSTSRVNVYSNENKMLVLSSYMKEMTQCNQLATRCLPKPPRE